MRTVAIIAPPLLGDTIMIAPHLSAFQAEGISVHFLAPPEICDLIDTVLSSRIQTVALPPEFFTTHPLPHEQLIQISTNIQSIDSELIFDHLGNRNAFELIRTLNCQSFGVSCEARHPYTNILSAEQLELWQFDTRSASECYADLYALAGIHLKLDPPIFNLPSPKKQIGNSILINPGAGSQTKRWPLDNFIEVAERLASALDSQITFLFGPKESDLLRLVQSKTHFTAYDGTALSLPALVDFIAVHDLLVTNDTAVMHLGASCGVSTIAIFTGGLHQSTKWFPYDVNRHAIFVGDQITPPNQPPDSNWGDNISPSEIVTSALRLHPLAEYIEFERA